jgi:hypothetical protein
VPLGDAVRSDPGVCMNPAISEQVENLLEGAMAPEQKAKRILIRGRYKRHAR